jgi:hypothetical protein
MIFLLGLWIGACLGAACTFALMRASVRPTPTPVERHHDFRKLDPVTKQALAEAFWLRADKGD